MSGEPIHWHYTPGIVAATQGKGIKGILDTRAIRPSTEDIGRKERPVVWFSANQVFEPTAAEITIQTASGTMVRAANVEDQAVQAGGLYRFGMPQSRLRSYLLNARELCISLDRRKRLARIAKRFGSGVGDWWFHPEAIQLDDPDLSFGFWLDGQWHSAPVSDAGAVLVRCTEGLLPLYEKRLRLISRF